MKRVISMLTVLAVVIGLLGGCGSGEVTETAPTSQEAPTVQEATASPAAIDALDGKKIIFIGNSYTMNGYAVMHQNPTALAQVQRSNDQGFFYQLCKANGMDVSVTNWCFGGHDTTHTFGGPCTAGKDCIGQDHASYLVDRCFDYVVIQCYQERHYSGDLAAHLQPIVELFREANPDVKFLLLVPHMACERDYAWVKDIPVMKDAGFTVCNWGQMLQDICQGQVQVPGAALQYTRSSFVISKTEADGHHQNMLAGYITALMTYCAITGDSAVGQTYAFCDDSSINIKFDLQTHKLQKYVYNTDTNFVEIFRSPEDMLGLQQLVDQYLEAYN